MQKLLKGNKSVLKQQAYSVNADWPLAEGVILSGWVSRRVMVCPIVLETRKVLQINQLIRGGLTFADVEQFSPSGEKRCSVNQTRRVTGESGYFQVTHTGFGGLSYD